MFDNIVRTKNVILQLIPPKHIIPPFYMSRFLYIINIIKVEQENCCGECRIKWIIPSHTETNLKDKKETNEENNNALMSNI